MAELENRDEHEEELARIAGIELRRQERNFIELFREDPNRVASDEVFWGRERTRIASAFTDALLPIYLTSAEQLLESQSLAVEWGIVSDGGAQWAREYSFELVRDLNATTRRTLQREIPRAIEEGLPIRDLRGRLSRTFGPTRAELIATTETTRAATQGQRQFVAELERIGVQTEAQWLTAQDERVCPICAPLNGVVRENGVYRGASGVFDGPPAHPRCRCAEIFVDLERVS